MWNSSSTAPSSRCAPPRALAGAISASTGTGSKKSGSCSTLSGPDLGTVEQAPRARIEGVAAVERAAVVPHHHVADAPLLAEGEARLRCMPPQLVEQPLAFFELEAHDVAVAPPAEKETLASGFRMRAHQRMARARRLPRIADCAVTLAH